MWRSVSTVLFHGQNIKIKKYYSSYFTCLQITVLVYKFHTQILQVLTTQFIPKRRFPSNSITQLWQMFIYFLVTISKARLRWSRGKRAGLWYPSSRIQTRPKPSHFSGEKFLSAPSFGGEVKPSVPCRKFTACKRTQKWRGSRHFRQNSRQFLAHSSTFGSRRSRCGGHLVEGVGTF